MAFVVGAPGIRPATSSKAVYVRRTPILVRSTRRTVLRMSSEVAVGDVVIIKGAYGRYTLGVVSNVGGKFADVKELEKFSSSSGESYVASKSENYESVTKMRTLQAAYDQSTDSYSISEGDVEAAKKELEELGGASDVKTPEPESKDYSKKPGFPKPTKTQAIIGAALGLVVSGVFGFGFYSARSTYANIDPSTDLYQNILLSGLQWGALLSLFTAGGLTIYSLTASDD
uniref:Uncharacterized protein n=2 Tax=Rhodosorus marinus TaxID=101924 RepID=A0A7S3A2W3_9RHOD|mmetsp:Transcript_41907/g.164254  ORF Transcript_41907/g.164254 Transcript_41907/m.164254 type:complete len:229 (+) Transcript_41907:115-801(+)|eukprot:CAMPEP_0113955236 /NCGR_PEP_ID=MMETSP0011_2-20120614/1167_1 /TAXON_ID=101924 /ORGANISM="Rhodosorus marinus" /LENGTH=228 /DNA_ID=CAMNT_0000964795 /DNA_START=68 /DNA_END=754 /DNA_ORIENTATION=- /assembly_acc=CAM_ASM_000156